MSTRDDARYQIGVEMDYWRAFLLKRVKKKNKRDFLLDEEVIVAAVLGVGSALLYALTKDRY